MPRRVEINKIDTNEVLSFEVFDLKGEKLASFEGEESFCTYIFTLTQPVQIRFQLEEFELVGNIYP